MRPVLYVAAPFSTRNAQEAIETDNAIQMALEYGWAPIFVPYVYQGLLHDDKPEERRIALEACASIVSKCDGFMVVCSRETEGTLRDLKAWPHPFTYTPRTLPRFT